MSDVYAALAAHKAAGAWLSWRREERAPGEVAVIATVRDGEAWAVVTFAGADLADCLTQLRWRIEGRGDRTARAILSTTTHKNAPAVLEAPRRATQEV